MEESQLGSWGETGLSMGCGSMQTWAGSGKKETDWENTEQAGSGSLRQRESKREMCLW